MREWWNLAGQVLQRRPRGLRRRRLRWLLAWLMGAWISATAAPYVPVQWTEFVAVDGQTEPVPRQWLQDEEARMAHSLRLPDEVPKTVPYHFEQPWWELLWFKAHRKASVRYFDHLCKTEAGQWILKKVKNVEGFYFARPQSEPPGENMADLYGLEMPWIQRIFFLTSDNLKSQGTRFIQPPIYNYRFVEQPRRAVEWQKHIVNPYIRLFGYTRERSRDQYGNLTEGYREKDPMQVVGIPKLKSIYGYTWRGLKRKQDREHGIAGGELLIYDLETKEILAVRRQFLITLGNPRTGENAAWEIAASCPQLSQNELGGEFTQFAFDVLQTIESSATRKE
jgi:hypothetical protein